MLRHGFFICCLLVGTLSGCTQFPELDERLSAAAKRAAYPDLVPVEQLRAQSADVQISPEVGEGLEARATRLQARAARLKGSVLNRADRARLDETVHLP